MTDWQYGVICFHRIRFIINIPNLNAVTKYEVFNTVSLNFPSTNQLSFDVLQLNFLSGDFYTIGISFKNQALLNNVERKCSLLLISLQKNEIGFVLVPINHISTRVQLPNLSSTLVYQKYLT